MLLRGVLTLVLIFVLAAAYALANGVMWINFDPHGFTGNHTALELGTKTVLALMVVISIGVWRILRWRNA
jgi:hypothetical protein